MGDGTSDGVLTLSASSSAAYSSDEWSRWASTDQAVFAEGI